MPRYSEEIMDELYHRNDIVDVVSSYVKLRQRGGEYIGLCPFHREKTPSFSVNAAKQMFYCFGCGAGGNVVGFVMRIENLVFTDAVKHLADRARMVLPEDGKWENSSQTKLKEALYDINKKAAYFFHRKLMSKEGENARFYLAERRLIGHTVKKFGLGFAPDGWTELCAFLKEEGHSDSDIERSGLAVKRDNGFIDKFRNRLMFPIIDAQKRVVGFGGRVMGQGEPKYLNSPDTIVFNKSRNLFALNYARKTRNTEIIIVEGYMDALALFQAGFENVSATLGTAMNREHCQIINKYFKGKTIILLFDSDGAGEAATLRVLPIMTQQNISVRVPRLRGAKDPDEFLVKYGSEAFAKELTNAKSPTQFRLDLARSRYPNLDNDALIGYLNEAASIVAAVEDPIERDVYISSLSEETGVSSEAIRGRTESKTAVIPDFDPSAFRKKPQNVRGVPDGVLRAARNVLYWMATHINLYEAIRDNLPPNELPLPEYQVLLHEIIKIRDAGKPATASDLVGRFEDLNDQQSVSVVFVNPFTYNNDDELKIALNDDIKIIKTDYINRMIEESKAREDYETLQKLGEIRINLPNSYI